MTDWTAQSIDQDRRSDEIASAGDYFELLKPRVMSLVIFTGLVGLLIAPGQLHPVIAVTALLCIAVGAGASGALNMWYDADIDALMTRTAGRPVPSGRVGAQEALTFGIVLSAFSVGVMGVLVNWIAAGLLAFTILYYAVFYTMWLKRSTPQNIVIGGAAGALPPVIGWAAVTGTVTVEPLVLFLIIFMWTPPHFWALSLLSSEDYARVGVPMLPVVAGERSTRRHILGYTLLLAPIGVLPTLLGFAGIAYFAVAAAAGAAFLWLAADLARTEPGEAQRLKARRLFLFSLVYLFGLFLALLVEHMALAYMF